jgi:hypothetical protein
MFVSFIPVGLIHDPETKENPVFSHDTSVVARLGTPLFRQIPGVHVLLVISHAA